MLKKAALILPVFVLLLIVPFSASAATTYHVPFDPRHLDICLKEGDEPAMWGGGALSSVHDYNVPSSQKGYFFQIKFPYDPNYNYSVVSGDVITTSFRFRVYSAFKVAAVEVIYSPYGYNGVGPAIGSTKFSIDHKAGSVFNVSIPSVTALRNDDIGEIVLRFYPASQSSAYGLVIFDSEMFTNGFDFSIGSGQLAEEKDEAGKGGNSATDSITSAIPGDTASFSSALQSFASSMSYAGTDAKWTFPAMKLPSIDGVMDEITLNGEQEIDISYWVSIIPSDILEVVQILCTIALIFFCVKELYGTISYFMVLKGGGSSE